MGPSAELWCVKIASLLLAMVLICSGCACFRKAPAKSTTQTSASRPSQLGQRLQATSFPPDPVGHAVDVHAQPWTTELARSVRIKAIPKRYEGETSEQTASPDGKYRAFVVDDKTRSRGQLGVVCIEDVAAKKLYAVIDLPMEHRPISDLAWASERYLQFDRWSQPHYGMHYLVDVSTMKLVHATPFPDEFWLFQSEGNEQAASDSTSARSLAQQRIRFSADAAQKIVRALPEIQAWDQSIRKLSNGKSHCATMMDAEWPMPRGHREYWLIAVGEDQPERFLRWQTLAVDAASGEVSVFDSLDDKLMTLAQWRAAK